MKLRDIVSANMKSYRLKAGLSQSQLADRVGKSVRYISALENQPQNVTLETLQVIAAGLGVTATELIREAGEPVPALVKTAKLDFDRAMALLNRYRTVMERQVLPPKRVRD